MILTPIDNDIRAQSAEKSDALASKNEASAEPKGPEFGQLMSQFRAAGTSAKDKGALEDAPADTETAMPDGQELTESGMPVPMIFSIHSPVSDSWSLKAVTLGPTLNVITSQKAAPDDQSLEAFARSQGLDETAVQWLMGTAPGQVQTSELATTPASALTIVAATTSAAGASAPLSALVSAAASTLPADTQAPLPANGSSNTAGMLQAAAATLWALAQSPEDSKSKVPTETTTGTTDIQIQLLREPTPAAVWMLRNQLSPEAAAARQLEKAGPSVSEIDLTQELSPESLESLLSEWAETADAPAPMSSAAHSNTSGGSAHQSTAQQAQTNAAQANASTDTPESTAAQRSENIQNLAEKMGQAVGQRILSEIEKGQWHLKLQLRPATLGHIEVEMRMLSGELDAVFNASHALTRELLQDGMSKLKDTLGQMGMDVASMQVKDGQTRQGGGDPTPKEGSKSIELVKNDSKSTNSQTIWVPRQKMGEDGWDVTV